jgi:ATP-dependent Lon protease
MVSAMDDTLTALPAVALPGVAFPNSTITITLDTDDARAAISATAESNDKRIVLVPKLDGRYATVGALAVVENAGELPNGQAAAILRVTQRARVGAAVVGDRAGLWLQIDPLTEANATVPVEAVAHELRLVAGELAEVRNSRRLPEILRTVTEPGVLADAITGWSDANDAHKVTVLEAVDLPTRLQIVLDWAKQALTQQRIDNQIRNDVNEGLEKTQREFLLRQQLQAIRKELGEGDAAPGTDYRAMLAGRVLPDAARKAIEVEIERLERSSEQSPERGWITTWLDRVFALPWGTRTEDNDDITVAREVLDADHHGLDDVKDRIIEFLAVRKLRSERSLNTTTGRGDGAVVTLVGPPGVGKTSLGESIAKAMGREFVRVSLGGIRDEAEIRGHRRTYVGAQAGRIVRAITEAGSMNPVVLLDEVDKLSAGGWSGDPTAALLEVLDSAQNHTFRDHYLEIELDLSDVVFIATANVADSIPGPLLDRMELVRLDGYTTDEKRSIARDHLLPRQLERAGLRNDEVIVPDDALDAIITGYTREAGVRNLERELGKLLRKVAAKVAVGPRPPAEDDAVTVALLVDDVKPYLGRPKVYNEVVERTDRPGVVTGLAVTGAGGDVLFIEASAASGEGLVITGQLGDVMKESAQIALSYVRANADALGISAESLAQKIHVHVPAGAVPKDGPSAGITMTTALVSLLTGRPVRNEVGMTGEVTLVGKVLPIGGVKQKVLAAHRAGLTEVVLPFRNGDDLDDVPEAVRNAMTFHLASTYDDVLAAAFARNPRPRDDKQCKN